MVDAVTLLAASSVGLAVDGETIAYVSGGARTARCSLPISRSQRRRWPRKNS
jgi:hypothetical protein